MASAREPASTEPEQAPGFPALVVQARAQGPVRALLARAAEPELVLAQEPAAVPVVQVPERAAERVLAQEPVRVPVLAQLVVALVPELERDPEPRPEVRYC